MRIPHLFDLYPTRVLGKLRPVSAIMTVSSAAAQPAVGQLLAGVASTVGTEPELEILSIDAKGTSYRVTVRSNQLEAEQRLYFALSDALAAQSVPLGTLRVAIRSGFRPLHRRPKLERRRWRRPGTTATS